MWTLRTGAGMDARLAKRSEAEPELRLGFSITSRMTRCWISSQRTATGSSSSSRPMVRNQSRPLSERHCMATFYSQWQSGLFGGLPVGDWLFIAFTIIGTSHVILPDLKAPSGMSSAVKPWHCCRSAITKPRRKQRLRWPRFCFQLAFTPVVAAVAAAGVELQMVLVDASRPNQHIYLMTWAELLVRLNYLHFRHDRHHR